MKGSQTIAQQRGVRLSCYCLRQRAVTIHALESKSTPSSARFSMSVARSLSSAPSVAVASTAASMSFVPFILQTTSQPYPRLDRSTLVRHLRESNLGKAYEAPLRRQTARSREHLFGNVHRARCRTQPRVPPRGSSVHLRTHVQHAIGVADLGRHPKPLIVPAEFGVVMIGDREPFP